MKRSLFLFSIISFLLISCVGEDVINENIPTRSRNLRVDGALFSLAIDEDNEEFLRIRTNFDSRDDVTVVWESQTEELVNFDENQFLKPVNNTSNLREKAVITAKVYNTEDLLNTGESTNTANKFTVKENAMPIAELESPISFFMARVSITVITKENLGITDEAEGLEAVIEGFPEKLEFIQTITSLDVADNDIPLFRAQFINFKLQQIDVPITWSTSDESILTVDDDGVPSPISKGTVTVTASVSGENTQSGEAISVSKALEVSDQTVVIAEPDPVPVQRIIGSGDFQGLTGYSAAGGFEIIEENTNPLTIEFSSNFDTGRVPDLVLYLSNSTRTNAGALFISETVSNQGAQIFELPEATNIDDYEFVLLYCRAFNVPVGFATIQR